MQSDSARIWDLAFAKPVRAIAVSELEQFIGLSAGARKLVTATQDKVNLWDTATGHRVASLDITAASSSSTLTPDGTRLLVQKRGDQETEFELWSLADARLEATLSVAGTPALTALDSTGGRIAVADFDRAVRIWDMQKGTLVAQVDLDMQPSSIELAAGGEILGAVFSASGASVWQLGDVVKPILAEVGFGNWQMAFSSSGSKVLVGTPAHGFQIFDTSDGRRIGPALGSGGSLVDENLLGFSSDELTVVTGGPASTARFWRVPVGPARNPAEVNGAESIWPLAGDAVALATPGAAKVVIGDRAGNVYILPADADPESFLVSAETVSFLGHARKVRLLAASPAGDKVASLGADNTVRVWDTATGLPHTFFGDAHGGDVSTIVFSPDASMLGILSGNQVQVMDADDGSSLAIFELAERHESIAFAANEKLFIGSEGGTLRMVSRDAAGKWTLQTLWQGNAAIRWLEVSPLSRYLVFVDQNNLAQQFILSEGRLGRQALQLPSRVEEVSYSPNGARVLFRTARWIHLASATVSGLRWQDAVFAPPVIPGSRIVFADPVDDAAAALGNRFFVTVSADSSVKLSALSFDGVQGSALFGNKEELLAEWRQRLGFD
jgi:WD40 repeat protein